MANEYLRRDSDFYQSNDFHRKFYTIRYRDSSHDSPEESRLQMISEMFTKIRSGLPTPHILNVASGPQCLEKQMRTNKTSEDLKLLAEHLTVTVDLANISKKKLMAKEFSSISHTQANGLHLPFRDNQFGLVVSNMGMDFSRRVNKTDPYDELFRVLSPGGYLIMNCHHPLMLDVDIRSIRDRVHRANWQYLSFSHTLLESEREIDKLFSFIGFDDIEKKYMNVFDQHWWLIKARKK